MTAVLVTGASRGIGRGLVAAFAAAGWDVAVTSRRRSDAEHVVVEARRAGVDAVAVECDVTRSGDVETAVERAVETFGGLDALVHNAVSTASSTPVDLEIASLDQWNDHASVSLRGLWRCARASMETLRDSGGCLLVLTSPAGIDGSANLSFYAAVKGGQQAFVRSLGREWGPLGVRVNGLAPLAMTDALADAFRKDPSMEQRLTRSIPMGRVGDPEHDIGPPAVFLCSDAARYVTGQTMVVSGGRLIQA